MTTQQDATQPGASELEFRSGTQQQVTLPERHDPYKPNARDAIEDAAAHKAAAATAERFRKMAGLPPEGQEPAPEQEAPQEPQGQPRDEHGRFASPNPPEPTEAPQEAPQQAQEPVQQAPAPQTQPTAAELTPETLVKVKVNGQEHLVPWGEVQRNFQIEQAARQKLERASIYEREVMNRAAALQQPAPNTQHTEVPADQNALITELADKIAFGNKDEIATTLQKFIGAQPSQQPVATPEVLQMVEQRLALMQHEAAARADLQAFSTEHQEIVKDPDLQQLVFTRTQRAMKDDLLALGADPMGVENLSPTALGFYHRQAQGLYPNVVRPTLTILRDAAGQVKGRFASPSGPTQSPAIQQRLDTKRSAPAPVSAAIQQRVPGPQPDKPLTNAEIIAQEREARSVQRQGINATPRR